MTKGRWREELSIRTHLKAIAVLWIVWGACVWWVSAKAFVNAKRNLFFENEFLVYTPVEVGFPVVLALLGRLFLRRAGPIGQFPFVVRVCYHFTAVGTVLAAVVAVIGCFVAWKNMSIQY